MNAGDSVVVAPGQDRGGPLRREIGILYAEVDPARCGEARRTLVSPATTHPDIFELKVHREPRKPAAFD